MVLRWHYSTCSSIINVFQQSVVFVANKACVFACLCYRLSSQSVHLYVNFTPVLLQHRNITGYKYEYAINMNMDWFKELFIYLISIKYLPFTFYLFFGNWVLPEVWSLSIILMFLSYLKLQWNLVRYFTCTQIVFIICVYVCVRTLYDFNLFVCISWWCVFWESV